MTRTWLNMSLVRKRLDQHPCLTIETNPVLEGAQVPGTKASQIALVLGQYSFLPRHIVELLTLGASRVGKEWIGVFDELSRNIDEELGSKTFQKSHYEILHACMKSELCLDVSKVRQGKATSGFLAVLTRRLKDGNRATAAGVVSALEDSATPELFIVGRIINQYAALAGLPRTPIQISSLADEGQLKMIWKRVQNGFTLEDFLALHVLFFEAGHSEGLADAVAPYLVSQSLADDFLSAYDATLADMDGWWEGLADEADLNH